MAFQRFKSGGQAAFTENITDDGGMPADGQYQTYGGANDGQYADPPFNGGEQQGTGWLILECALRQHHLYCVFQYTI